jgi:drug/metabolite transporter (DMT)-like permease
MKNGFKTYSAVLFAMVFWALSFIWFKMANETFRPLTIVFFRLILAVLLLSLYLFITKSYVKIRKDDRKLFLLLALFEPFLYFIGESYGLTYVSATAGSVIISTIPVVATIAAWIVFRERLKAVNYAGIILSFIGIIVFVLKKDGTLSYNLTGLALLGLAVISAVGYNLTLSRLVGHYSPVYIVNVQNVMGAVSFLPWFLLMELPHLADKPFGIKELFPVFQLALFASCGAFILFAWSVKKMGISKANVFTNLIPVFTAVLAFILIGDRLTMQNIAGMGIVVAGLFMSQVNGRRKQPEEALILTGKTA